MKTVFKICVVFSVLFIAGCGGKSDSSAPVVGPGPSDGGAGGGTGGAGGSSGPVANPARTFEILNPADGIKLKGVVSESGANIYLLMPQITYRLKTHISSANLGFIIEDSSIRKGCQEEAETIARYQELEIQEVLDNPDGNNIYTRLLEDMRRTQRLEAGYFSLTPETLTIPEPLKNLALDAARNLGFTNVRTIYLNSVSEVNVFYHSTSFVNFIYRLDEFRQTASRLLFRGQQQRLLIGELCDLLLGKVDLHVYEQADEASLGRAKVEINLQDY